MTIGYEGIGTGVNGSGFTKTYWFYSNDSATTTSPITHVGGAANTFLTNNGLGSNTDAYNPNSKAGLWDASTDTFDFSSLKIGDIVEFRVDLLVNHAAAQEINIVADLAEGTGSTYTLNVFHAYYKTASTGIEVTAMFRLYIGNDETKNGSARFRLTSLDACSVIVQGWLSQIVEV